MKKIILLLSFLLLFPVNVFAQEYDISFAIGAGNRNAKVGVLGARKYFKPLFERGSFSAVPSFGFYGTYIDVKPSEYSGDTWVLNASGGLTFHFDREKKNAFFSVFFGPSYISDKVVGGRELGSHFQFGTTFSLGTKFGGGRRHSIEAFLMHYSHAKLADKDNDGYNIYGGAYRYYF